MPQVKVILKKMNPVVQQEDHDYRDDRNDHIERHRQQYPFDGLVIPGIPGIHDEGYNDLQVPGNKAKAGSDEGSPPKDGCPGKISFSENAVINQYNDRR